MIRKREDSKGKARYQPVVKKGDKQYTARQLLGDGTPGTYRLERDARTTERKMLDAIDGLDRRVGAGTCRRLVERWLAEMPRSAETTRHHYEQQLKPFTKEFGDRVPDSITRDEARDFARRHRNNAQVAKTMFNDAIMEFDPPLATRNPFQRLKLEAKTDTRQGNRIALTEDELLALADCSHVVGEYGPMMRAQILISAYEGLRFGEMAAMRHDWIQGDALHVDAQVTRRGVERLPKSRKAGEIPWVPQAAEAYRQMPRTLSDYVFTLPNGDRLDYLKQQHLWRRVRTAFLELDRPRKRQQQLEDDLTWHTLRHTAATFVLERGLSRYHAQRLLRHKDPSLIDKTYGHPDSDRLDTEMLDAFQAPAPKNDGGLGITAGIK